MSVQCKAPTLALVISVETAFFHCAKCVIRSGIWEHEKWGDIDGIPSLAQILIDHANISDSAEEVQKSLDDAYANNVY